MFTSPALVDHLLLALRIAAGLLLVGAAAQIMLGAFGGPGLRGFARYAARLGLRPPTLIALSAGLSTLISGVGLVVGGFASVAALAVVAFTVGAAALSSASSDARGASLFEKLLWVVALVCVADLGPMLERDSAAESATYARGGSAVNMEAGL